MTAVEARIRQGFGGVDRNLGLDHGSVVLQRRTVSVNGRDVSVLAPVDEVTDASSSGTEGTWSRARLDLSLPVAADGPVVIRHRHQSHILK